MTFEMVKIEAVIRPFALDTVKQRLIRLGLGGLTVTEVRGFGRTGGAQGGRSSPYVADFVPKLKIEVVVASAAADSVVDAIREAAATGRVGDGKIFVSPVLDVVRVRTGERGLAAV